MRRLVPRIKEQGWGLGEALRRALLPDALHARSIAPPGKAAYRYHYILCKGGLSSGKFQAMQEHKFKAPLTPFMCSTCWMAVADCVTWQPLALLLPT